MAKLSERKYDPVDASPVKSFFVSMLTRDIRLEDAILDLLDNCVDGALRSIAKKTSDKKPFEDFFASIEYNKDLFSIEDNCGGIPWALKDYAFRMGRANDRPEGPEESVGVYGIGMKRAIFKLGRDCLISTQNHDDRYEVEITPSWIANEGQWTIPVRSAKKQMRQDGTTIVVGSLYKGISARFSDDYKEFTKELKRLVSTHYSFIIDKGFKVKINKDVIDPKPTRFIYSRSSRAAESIRPFVFKATTKDDVEVFLVIGFTRPITVPSDNDLLEDREDGKYSSADAGWTILCNDRAVVYCDRTELTGWGDAGVPRFHNQFIAITGIVEFRAANPSKLPTTTTKRGIDASSSLFLQVKQKMREGMRIFIDYTNAWKGREDEAKKHTHDCDSLRFDEVKARVSQLKFTATRSGLKGAQVMPSLPLPKKAESNKRRISFIKPVDEIKAVAKSIFEDSEADPSLVGERCFDLYYRETQK